jgi:hypothetical protein
MRQLSALLVLALAACASFGTSPTSDAGMVSSSSSGGSSSSSGANNSVPEAGADAGLTSDAGTDAAAFSDARADATSVVDAGNQAAPSSWEAYAFSTGNSPTSGCAGGARYVGYSPRYAKWVGLELCAATKYKIYLGETKAGAFLSLVDTAGSGQDHCELVNPTFTIPNEDLITSGTCTTCAMQTGPSNVGALVYARANFGQPFQLITWPQFNHYTGAWYNCGVSIP